MGLFDFLRRERTEIPSAIHTIRQRRDVLRRTDNIQLQKEYSLASNEEETVAVAAVAAERVLGQELFDVQLQAALALTRGRVVEMQTGEGKTLAAVPAAAWYARSRQGVHVMTVNDYLARRDSEWMGGIYRMLGLTVAHIAQGMTVQERRAAYRADITYATATEVGFDYLRDQLAFYPEQQVHRPFATALIDEADCILIDEARIPLVIAGGTDPGGALPAVADAIVRHMHHGVHFIVQSGSRNVTLTDRGIARAERLLQSGNLYDEANLSALAALQDALHARMLLHRDVDYIVKNGLLQSVDEWKGRVALDRRWPAGLQTALEVKEGVATRPNGSILGSLTLQNLVGLYPQVCGMTGTAVSQADELYKVYGLEVQAIPTNRPMVRVDHPDVLCSGNREKDFAVVDCIRAKHLSGQPVLVGTGSVEESEHLSRLLGDLPHQVLNARQDEHEAAVIAQAGQRGAVTISTNMAGRGTDIRLGEGVGQLGGLCIIGTNRAESRRIDNQLRGRAGRQGDPGESHFFVSAEDDLVRKYDGETPEQMQRMAEGQNLEIRLLLNKYESTVEGQRSKLQDLRQQILDGTQPCESERERLVSLRTIDDLWSNHLWELAELRAGIHWVSWGGRDPLFEFVGQAHASFQALEANLPEEIARRLEDPESAGVDPTERGAVWTYMTTDQPFGTLMERMARGIRRKYARRNIPARHHVVG